MDEPADIHLVEQGDSWEVWRVGDSMPLGSFMTRGEAEEKGMAQAEADGVRFLTHELPPHGEDPV